MSRTVLVCGGRYYDRGLNQKRLWEVLDEEHARDPIGTLVHGGCSSGADQMADVWATQRGVDLIVYPANWKAYGNSAGPRRNSRMLAHSKPDLVVAFPGGNGTEDMVRKVVSAGVQIRRVTA